MAYTNIDLYIHCTQSADFRVIGYNLLASTLSNLDKDAHSYYTLVISLEIYIKLHFSRFYRI